MHFNSKKMLVALCAGTVLSVQQVYAQKNKGQDKKATVATDTVKPAAPMVPPAKPAAIKKFSEVITPSAQKDSGLFNYYLQGDRHLIEIPEAIFGRDMIIIARLTKSSAVIPKSMNGYAGDGINAIMVRFEKGPNNKVFLKKISVKDVSKDSTQPMYQSVMNSNLQPIAAAFEPKAFSADGKGLVIDITEMIANDNDIFFFGAQEKTGLGLGGMAPDKSWILDVRSFPTNMEIRTVKTYMKMPAGSVTLETNTSIVLLPEVPMQPRYFDPRVGYFAKGITDFDANPQGVKELQLITRWRLEPKPEDMEKYKRGELVEPVKPIVFYIDPTTPEKWVKYLIAGVNDWQSAFEQAGFKNAIVAKRAPTKEQDSTWSLEDARNSAIVYKPSPVANASGPHIHDPRSGEILESHVNWYHNVMKLLRNWYMVQASPNDERARKMLFDDELMGELIRFVSSHEVGHTLGLRHNFGSSSTYPVEKLRDKEWVKKNGFAASIMDYARFNYVAQPGDGITGADLYPRINFYDKWAIEWGYKLIPDAKSAEEETATLNKWTIEKLKDKIYWFGTESNPEDPRSQSEDLGDNAMKASAYGIKNLQRILPNLESWTRTPNDGYDNLEEMYKEVVSQYTRYNNHVAKNIGGRYETPKTVEQGGDIYAPVPKATQKEAVAYLQEYVFDTPKWLISKSIFAKTGASPVTQMQSFQSGPLNHALGQAALTRLQNAEIVYGAGTYTVPELLADLKKGIWKELPARQSIDIYRRNLQREYVGRLIALVAPPVAAPVSLPAMPGMPPMSFSVTPPPSDLGVYVRPHMVQLRSEIRAAMAVAPDAATRAHLADMADKLTKTLEPK